nr:MAG TPA: hypothetical protein [Bacteriophage sp.]
MNLRHPCVSQNILETIVHLISPVRAQHPSECLTLVGHGSKKFEPTR